MADMLFCCFRRNKAGAAACISDPQRVHTESGNTQNKADMKSRDVEGPVLVELFTSQGCTASTSAEHFMTSLGKGGDGDDVSLDVPVLVLAYHVDFWDYRGWKDPFASSLWTARQRSYCETRNFDSIYTPQVIVQGRSQCSGSESEEVLKLVRSAPRFGISDIKATFSKPSETSLEVRLSGPLRFKVEGYGLDITVALYEDGNVTDCSRGENKGRVLTNDFVVRGLGKACTVRDISARKSISGKVVFDLWEGFSISKCGMVMFFQKTSTMDIQGAQPLTLPQTI